MSHSVYYETYHDHHSTKYYNCYECNCHIKLNILQFASCNNKKKTKTGELKKKGFEQKHNYLAMKSSRNFSTSLCHKFIDFTKVFERNTFALHREMIWRITRSYSILEMFVYPPKKHLP